MTVDELIESLVELSAGPSENRAEVVVSMGAVFRVTGCERGFALGGPAVNLRTESVCWRASDDSGGK